jgi:hypothetical protein
MGRFNWIWRAPCALSVLVFALGAPHLATASLPAEINTSEPLGSCNVTRFTTAQVNPAGDGYVTLDNGLLYGYAGAGTVFEGTWIGNTNDITHALLASCLGIAPPDIRSLVSVGGLSEADEDVTYIGFKFTLDVNVGGFEAGREYEYAIKAVPTGPTVEETREQIAGYMQNRASQTIAAQPDLIGLLSGSTTRSAYADVTQSNGNFDFATSGDRPVWAMLQGSWSEFGTTENSYFFGAVGAHANLSPDVMVGIMFEFDRLTQTDGATSVEGDGYLVGPYFVARLPNRPLFIEGRLLTGQTENEVTIGGAATETFDTQRTFASIKVAGQLNYGELVLTPSLTASHLRDVQDAFVNTLGTTVAAQSIEVNSVAAGLNFAQPVSLPNGELMLTGGISGIWSSSEGTEFASSAAPASDGPRARITFGASYTTASGVVLSAGSFYDGIGLNDYESYGLDLGVQIQF